MSLFLSNAAGSGNPVFILVIYVVVIVSQIMTSVGVMFG